MKISKKCRYGLRALIDLSANSVNEYIVLGNIAERNNISPQYLEQVFADLRRAGIVKGIKACIGKVKDAVGNVAETIKSYLHFSVPDVGPLTDYETWMPDFIDGMAKGIDDNKYKLVDAVQGMASDMRIGVPALSAPALKNVGNYNQPVQTNTESNGNLLGLLTQLVESMQGGSGDITIPIYLGNDLIDERIVRANDRRTLRSGGRA